MNKREKTYLIVVILLMLVLTVKSTYFDEYQANNNNEQLFKDYVYKLVEDKENGFLQRMNIATYKVVSIKKLQDEGKSIIQVYDENSKQYKTVEIPGQYKAKIRKYLFYFLPFGENSVLSRE